MLTDEQIVKLLNHSGTRVDALKEAYRMGRDSQLVECYRIAISEYEVSDVLSEIEKTVEGERPHLLSEIDAVRKERGLT